MFNNPEFTKNLKLEFNLTRLVILILLLAMVTWIGWDDGSARGYNYAYDKTYAAKSLFHWLSGFGFLVTIVGGTYLVANSFQEELKLKSWDFVRMSSLPPLKILTGKIFGAPAVVWCVTLVMGLPFLLYAGLLVLQGRDIIGWPAIATLLSLAVCLISWIVLSYSTGLLMSLSVDTKISRGAAFLITALTFILGLFIGGTIISSFESMRWTRTMQHWYGIDLYKLDQIALILYFFALWSFIGAWRILRRSLQYRDKPWIWIGFITSTSFFLSGFSSIQSYSIDTFGWPILVSLATLILTCATEATDTIRYRSFIHSLQQKSYGDAFRAVPLWVVSFAALTICMLLNVLLAGPEKFLNVLLFLTSLIIFVVRDLLAFHAIYWMPNVRRPAMGVVAYAVTLYGFFPALAATINHSYRLFFFPNAANNFISGYWLMLLIETGIASYFALRYWKATMNKTDNP